MSLSTSGLARGSRGDEQVKGLLTHVLERCLREHCQHPRRGDSGSGVRALPVVPLEGGANRLTWMNDHDGQMTAAEQDDAEGCALAESRTHSDCGPQLARARRLDSCDSECLSSLRSRS